MNRRTFMKWAGAAAVFLCDTMGEVPLFYAASDVAFVAGSLVPIGGHNLLEASALGVPVVAVGTLGEALAVLGAG